MNLWDENIAEIPPNMDPIPPHTQHPTPAFTHLRVCGSPHFISNIFLSDTMDLLRGYRHDPKSIG